MTDGSLLEVLVGGLLAIGGGFAAQWGAMYFENRRQRKRLAGAFAGEIGALCAIVEHREYVKVLRSYEDAAREGRMFHIPPLVTLDFMPVFNADPASIGQLSASLAQEAAYFYTKIKAMLEDVRADRTLPPDAQAVEQHARQLREMLEATMALGNKLAERLRREAE